MLSLLQLALLVVLGWGARAETGCPPAEDIVPCHCIDPASPMLRCPGIADMDSVRNIFKNTERYFFHEVQFHSAILPYLPHEIFERTQVGKLLVEESHMNSLFDMPPKSDSLYEIQLFHTHFTKNKLFESGILKNLTNLRVVGIDKSSFTNIPSDLGNRFPSSVRQITFKNTPIRSIAPGAFDGLENLDKFAVQFGNLDNLTRDIFPRPFNVRFLYFDHNQISSVPRDLFTEMPNLQILTLSNNSLSFIPEEAFAGRDTNVPYLGLEGNPLNCNCLLLWLIKDKPEMIDGTCHKPLRLLMRPLKDLVPKDFNC